MEKYGVLTMFGAIGGFIVNLFGGFDVAFRVLAIFMVVDIVMGLVVAARFKKSPKTIDGVLSSKAFCNGLFRKGGMIFFVLVSTQLDLVIGSNYIRSACIMFFISNELLSIIENAGTMGIEFPDVVKNSVSVLRGKGEVSK